MMADLEQEQNIVLIPEEISIKLVRFFYYRVMGKIGFRKETWVKSLFQRFFCLSRFSYNVQEENYVLFLNSKFWTGYDERFLKRLKRKYPYLKFVLYIVDPMKNGFENIATEELLDQFDLILSINRRDCEKYGFEYYPLIYSFKEERNYETKTENDLYYLGSGSDRTGKLLTIIEQAKREKIKYSVCVLQNCQEEKAHTEEIEYLKQALSYEENVRRIRQSNCILELMHSNFDNPTQRYIEAIVYKKKLLSDNQNIKTFPFYASQYMQIFTNPEEIDWEWVKKEEDVNYQYDNCFSPIGLINFLKERI